MSSTKNKPKLGRPTDFKPEYCEMLIEHMKKTQTYESFSTELGVCRKTLYNWERDNPSFLHAKRIGKEFFERSMFNIGMSIATGKIKGNPACFIFLAKNTTSFRDDVPPETDHIEGLDFE